jgi:hypothetical protein
MMATTFLKTIICAMTILMSIAKADSAAPDKPIDANDTTKYMHNYNYAEAALDWKDLVDANGGVNYCKYDESGK